MVDNLPLIPGKDAACTDVRTVLRQVFRELDYLPPLSIQNKPSEKTDCNGDDVGHSLPGVGPWVDKYKSECKKVSDHEDEVKMKHAERVAREPLPNLYKLHQQRADKQIPKWRLDMGLLSRKDLKPAVEQNAGRDGSLWVKNILNVSSCHLNTVKAGTVPSAAPVALNIQSAPSVQTFSIGGEVVCRETPVATFVPPSERADYILCVPPQLNFVNCFVGQTYMKCIRLVNVTKFECRLSITPPKRRELDVEINSPRGLTITSGATVELRIRFKPTNVRVLTDQLVVRVSRGQTLALPIECYMEPPLLGTAAAASELLSSGVSSSSADCSGDVLELGARLLGDVHCARALLYCEAEHATFFVLTEDAWMDWNLDCVTARGCVVADSFAFWPASWRGGGLVRARAWCRGARAGAHAAALRVLSSTATQRRLCLLADVLHFRPHHLIIEAHEKDFDICDEDDPACEYYVNVGTALPNRSLTASVHLVNCSPITYNYYWGARRWGACHCWEQDRESRGSSGDSGPQCFGAQESKRMANEDPKAYARKNEATHYVEVEPVQGEILARSSCTLTVHVPDVGAALGVQRTVLRLILKDIPRESFPADYEPIILDTTKIASVPMPGSESSVREVCEVVCAEMEVWWEVVPLRFAVHPPVVPLCHSRRLESIDLHFTACKLFGWDKTRAWWEAPASAVRPPAPALQLSSAQCAATRLTLPLLSLPNHFPETEVLTMVSANEEWKVDCVVTRKCDTRHPALQPALSWLGVVLPKTRMRTTFSLKNDTYQQICFWCEAFRWIGENRPRPACVGRIPCKNCKEIACTCALLTPGRGALSHKETADICYNVNAPEGDGCVATLLQARRCAPDLCVAHGAAATQARAALVAYRVLAPRVALRVRACGGVGARCETECGLDVGELRSELGTSTLRPSAALVAGRRTCYRLRVSNVTPLSTSVHFDEPIDGTDLLRVKFVPNDFRVTGHGEIDVRVILNARKVCGRRIFVYRAKVMHSSKPIYLVVDTAVAGLQISLQVPIGGGTTTDEFVIMRRTQKEETEDDESQPSTPEEKFTEEDRKRAVVKENVCRCQFDLQYIPPVRRPSPPLPEGEYKLPEIVTEPPSLTRVCRCFPYAKPFIPDAPESISLEFINIPLRRVCERRLVLRNESVVTVRWSTAVRRWPRRHTRTIHVDQWAGDVFGPGVALACRPASGVLASFTDVEIFVQVYADCWGLYWDQILIQIQNVEPIVLDVWMQVIGPPLQFKIQPHYTPEELPTVWFSSSDLTRSLVVKNVSRSELVVHAYVTHEIERVQDVLPLRLYMRLYDVLPVTCPCVTTYNSDVGELSSTLTSTTSYSNLDMDTGVELYLAPDYGFQEDSYYNVQPEVCTIKAGECMEWEVMLRPPPSPETAPSATVLLRLQPHIKAGDNWYRDEPGPQLVRLRQAARVPQVKLSCEEIVIKICALDLPHGGFLRARKHFQVVNTGNDRMGVSLHTSLPWCIVQGFDRGHYKKKTFVADCESLSCDEAKTELVMLDLSARSSTQVCVEVCISTLEAWPCTALMTCSSPTYAPQRRETTLLHLYDDIQVLVTLPLEVVVEYPVIKIKPALVDFGLVTDGDSRKTYITISHTSATKTLKLTASIVGCKEYSLRPCTLQIAPGGCERIYIQYTSVWRYGPAEASITVSECSEAAGASSAPGWCRAAVPLRASPTLDHKWHTDVHDHTDDSHLLPERVRHFLP